MIYIAFKLVKGKLLQFEMFFKIMYRSKWAVSGKEMIEQTRPYSVKKLKNNINKMTPR